MFHADHWMFHTVPEPIRSPDLTLLGKARGYAHEWISRNPSQMRVLLLKPLALCISLLVIG